MIVLTAEQAAEVDRRTTGDVGIPGLVLMENAGRGVAHVLARRWPDALVRGVVVVAGPGNNGGDGFVVARALHALGVGVSVFVVGSRPRLSVDAAHQWTVLERAAPEVGIIAVQDNQGVSALRQALAGAGLAVDALFGTGLARAVEGVAADVIASVNASSLPVVSIDIPSGVNGTTGHVLGCAVRAQVTVCCGALKRGVLVHPGAAFCGALFVAEIGFPAKVVAAVADGVELPSPREIGQWIPARPLTAHKGTAGRLAVVAGSRGMGGAAVLATNAALRTGAGLVTLCLPESTGSLPVGLPAEAMTRWVSDAGEGAFGPSSAAALRDAVGEMDAVALGPGVGRRPDTLATLAALLDVLEVPSVVDADGLRAIPFCLRTSAPRVLTPHPGEMATLLGCPLDDVLADPVGKARECAQRHGVVALLKGPRTVVAAPDGRVRINFSGNPGMASGGMGDTLTGVIGGLLVQGVPAFEAAATGAFVHGRAADRVVAARGERGLLAHDVAEALPAAIDEVRTHPSDVPFVESV